MMLNKDSNSNNIHLFYIYLLFIAGGDSYAVTTPDTKKGQQVRKIIRERLKNYDMIDSHPDIGDYGDPTNREWRQYLLPETNEESVVRCPITGRTVKL